MKKPEILSMCPARRYSPDKASKGLFPYDEHHEPADWPWAAITLGPGGPNPTWKAEQRVCKHCCTFFLHIVDIEQTEEDDHG
jgi:hypothetical protein